MTNETLYDLLDMAQRVDNGMVEIDIDEMLNLGEAIEDKVENTKAVIDHLFALEQKHRSDATASSEAARVCANKIEEIKTRLCYVLHSFGLKGAKGKSHSAWIHDSKIVVPKFKANAETFADYPEYVDRKITYTIRKQALKESENEQLMDIEHKYRAQFRKRTI